MCRTGSTPWARHPGPCPFSIDPDPGNSNAGYREDIRGEEEEKTGKPDNPEEPYTFLSDTMEIVPGIHMVDRVNGNSYILVRDSLTVIDTGIPGSGKKILSYIREKLHRDPGEIRTVIITHFHMDHTGGVVALKTAAPGAKVAIGNADAGYVNGTRAPPVHAGFSGLLLRIAGTILRPGTFQPDILLKDGDRIDGLLCIAVSGHTPGSIGLLDEGTKTFFAGDILRFDGTAVAEGPSRFTMDPERSHRSIRKIALLDYDILLPGHGVPLRPDASVKVREFARTLVPAD